MGVGGGTGSIRCLVLPHSSTNQECHLSVTPTTKNSYVFLESAKDDKFVPGKKKVSCPFRCSLRVLRSLFGR